MTLEISFPDSTLNAPVLIFRDGEKICRCQRPRWVQLIALMVHRDRSGIGQRFVTAGDLEHLLAFRGTSLPSSVKWFTNTLPHLPSLMKSYIRKQTTIRHGGPYRFLLDASNVLVDPLLLSRYLRLIYITRKIEPLHNDSQLLDLLKAGARAANSYDLETCNTLFSACMAGVNLTSNLPPTFKSMMYVRLASIEQLLHGPTSQKDRLFQIGRNCALKLKNPQDRCLMLTHNLSNHLFLALPTADTVREMISCSQRVIELTQELPRWSRDRAELLFNNYYLRASLTTQFDLKENVKQEIDQMKQALKIIEDSPNGTLARKTDSNTMEYMMLNLKLTANSQSRRKPDESDLAIYKMILNVRALGEINTLGLAVRIGHNYIRSNNPEEGVEFLTDALAQHACLHQFFLYRRIIAIRQKMLSKM